MKKRKSLKKITKIKIINEKIYDKLRQEFRKVYGNICQICEKERNDLGLFHVLPKGKYKKIRFHKENLLWAGWFCCHHPFHHDYYEAEDRIVPKIKKLLGVDFRERLMALDIKAPKLTRSMLEEMAENGAPQV